MLQPQLDGGAEASAAMGRHDLVLAKVRSQQVCRPVVRTGVDADHPVDRMGLLSQLRQGARQPAGTVVRHDNSNHSGRRMVEATLGRGDAGGP